MLDAANEALEFARERQREDVEKDRILAPALVKEIEIIGEAASQLPADFIAQHPQIPWSKAIGMRHRLVHRYAEIDFELLWDTVVGSLPPLIVDLERLLGDAEWR
jgi:uncharacterized protein with HEPN domain